ncbi:MAG: TetR/AcrR family transcriptional regulator C-terminal domain-containing protein [Anaerovibrio sp.]|uniref:TetR/AcrR family transcriptional regulator C-terminal domain-containing protein n=1 Tax=Anaerovibrio sp. TaxID=1872532 RepID=UPI0025DA59FF|nr:TetR/AcrR family transcriptional regulator C-terminal domain-containing protein [Anaerovibrio sp.]MCR5177221.1 TetR/AcrR family transcriptional regulator C-terminal domain-containing protein [Anaerovibrio sp.]
MIVKQTTKDLLGASLRELSTTKSIEKITIREITQNCGLTSTTFYNHFTDKYDLLVWIYHKQVEKLYARLGNDITWDELLKIGITIMKRNRHFYHNAISNTSGQDSFQKAAIEYTIRRIKNYVGNQRNDKELSAEYMYIIHYYVYGLFYSVKDWIFKPSEMTLNQLVRLLCDSMPESLKKYLH